MFLTGSAFHSLSHPAEIAASVPCHPRIARPFPSPMCLGECFRGSACFSTSPRGFVAFFPLSQGILRLRRFGVRRAPPTSTVGFRWFSDYSASTTRSKGEGSGRASLFRILLSNSEAEIWRLPPFAFSYSHVGGVPFRFENQIRLVAFHN